MRARGPFETADLAGSRLKELVSSGDRLTVLVLALEGRAKIHRDDLGFQRATAGDGRRYERDIGTDSATTFAQRLSESTACFLVASDHRLVHASWVTLASAWTRELRHYFSPPQGDAYVYESFTRADARGRGVYPFALMNISAWLATRGVARLWVAVEEDNIPSLKAVGKAGFTEAYTISYRRKLGRLTVGSPAGPLAEMGAGVLGRSPRAPHERARFSAPKD